MSERPTIVLAHYDSETLSDWRGDLEAGGFRVQATSSGTDVLKRVETQAADAVVIDPLLPKRNGLAVLKTIKAQPATARVALAFERPPFTFSATASFHSGDAGWNRSYRRSGPATLLIPSTSASKMPSTPYPALTRSAIA